MIGQPRIMRRRRARSFGARPMAPGKLVGIAHTERGWVGVLCDQPALTKDDPTVFRLSDVSALRQRDKEQATRWVGIAESRPRLPRDLAALRDRYLGRALRASGPGTHDARLVLKLIDRLGEQARAASSGGE